LQTYKKNLEGTHIRKFFEESGVDIKNLSYAWTDNKELIQFVERVLRWPIVEWTNWLHSKLAVAF